MEETTNQKQFGTLTGVFLPTLLTILGAVMYLRVGWVVGNAGLIGAFAIILLANLITFSTALSIASVATNIRVRAGGAFSIISQSLGLEVSGSVSVPFYIAQSISVAFYILAFAEGWQVIFPQHPTWLIVLGAFSAAFVIAYISASLASKIHYLILTAHIIALGSVFLGSFAIGGKSGMIYKPEMWGSFTDGNFWVVFAVFFPAVTGILAGVNMSGNLKDPRKSIPIGTISAVVLSMVVYLLLAFWFAYVATPQEMLSNFTLMVDKALWGPAVLMGLLAATFSAALTSLVGAPRILQAIAANGIIPKGDMLGKIVRGEPRPAMFVTGGITAITLVIGLLSGGLNAIAPFMTMFFLITYATLNGVVLLEQSLGLISFRPTFTIPRFVPLVGLVGCLFVMFLINPIFSAAALIVIVALYAYLSRRTLQNPWGDVRSGLFVTLAEWAAKRVSRMPDTQERAWKPNLLIPISQTETLIGSYRFLHALTYPRGSVHVLGIHPPEQAHRVKGAADIIQAFQRDNIFARATILEDDDFVQGLRLAIETLSSVFFRPNALFITLDSSMDEEQLTMILKRAQHKKTGAILYAAHPIAHTGREQTINVWIRDQSPEWQVGLRLSRLDLSLLLAYQIARNWNADINLITVISDPDQRANGEAFLQSLITLGRMPKNTHAIVEVGDFNDYLTCAPRADLHIFGIDRQRVSLAFVQRMVEQTRASCLFVQDSGQESALA
ncbi:MAG: Na-K-Cl cotransporter [Chloroflexi bacterium]|nr:MAG: Na-K-Cl cotransporter [Chloroflexota bacterium]